MRRLPRRPNRRLCLLGGAALLSALAGLSACQSQRITDTYEEADLGVAEDLRRLAPPPDFRPPPDLLGPDVHVVITADNAYAFGWGLADRVTKLNGRPPTTVAGDIFNCPLGTGPEEYDIPAAEAPPTSYIYVIAWADDATTQGVIGQFDRGGAPVYTGGDDWEVCATGLFYEPSGTAGGGPTLEVVNQQITRCNAGQGDPLTTSAGWVGTKGTLTAGATGLLVAGEDNSSPSGDFPIVCQKDPSGKRGVDAAARWMWYSPDGKSPFRHTGGHNPTRAFLIFRLPSKTIVIG